MKGKCRVGLIILILVGCETAPPLLEPSNPVEGLGLRSEGAFVVLDRTEYENSFSREGKPLSPLAGAGDRLILEAAVSRIMPKAVSDPVATMGNSRLFRLEGELPRGDGREPLVLEMRYEINEIEQVLSARQLPADLELLPVSRKALYGKQALPFTLTRGTWKGRGISVLCTCDYPMTDRQWYPKYPTARAPWPPFSKGETPDGWKAFLSDNQIFQVAAEDGRVLGEVRGGSFRIFDTVAAEDFPSMVTALGVVRLLNWFSITVHEYRYGWGPGAHPDAGSAILPYSDFPHRFTD